MMEKLAGDAALDAAARVNTRENVRLTFNHKVEQVIQEIVDSNFDLYKRITDDQASARSSRTYSSTSTYAATEMPRNSSSRASPRPWSSSPPCAGTSRKTARTTSRSPTPPSRPSPAFLNTEGGDLLLGVADDGTVVGIEPDRLDNDDKFMLHVSQVIRNGLGARAGTCVDPKVQIVDGKGVCVVSCQRSPEPVFLKWKGVETERDGDFFVRSGPGTVRLSQGDTEKYVRTRFGHRVSGREDA